MKIALTLFNRIICTYAHYENVPFEIPDNWVWTTVEEISNYGDCNNVSVTDIADDEWILELEDIEKDTAPLFRHYRKKKETSKVCVINSKKVYN